MSESLRLRAISSKIEDMRKKYNSEKTIESTYLKQKDDMLLKINKMVEEKDSIGMKMSILQEASTEARNNAKDLLEDVATNAVQMVLGENLTVDIELNTKGQSATAEIILKAEYPNEIVETDPTDEDGGGLADIVALSTFLSIGQLVGKDNLAPLFLDEPSKYVSGSSDKVADFLEEMAEYTGKQIFLATNDEYQCNLGYASYKFELDENGTTQYKRV